MQIDATLRKIAEDLRAVAVEIDAGHPVSTEALTTAARRLDAQAEMIEEGLIGPAA